MWGDKDIIKELGLRPSAPHISVLEDTYGALIQWEAVDLATICNVKKIDVIHFNITLFELCSAV